MRAESTYKKHSACCNIYVTAPTCYSHRAGKQVDSEDRHNSQPEGEHGNTQRGICPVILATPKGTRGYTHPRQHFKGPRQDKDDSENMNRATLTPTYQNPTKPERVTPRTRIKQWSSPSRQGRSQGAAHAEDWQRIWAAERYGAGASNAGIGPEKRASR